MKQVKKVKLAILGLFTLLAFQNCRLVDDKFNSEVPEAKDITRLHYRYQAGLYGTFTPPDAAALSQAQTSNLTIAVPTAELEINAPQGQNLAKAHYRNEHCRISGSIAGSDYQDLVKLVSESSVSAAQTAATREEIHRLEVSDKNFIARDYYLSRAGHQGGFVLNSHAAIRAQLNKIIEKLFSTAANCPAPQPGLAKIDYSYSSGFSAIKKTSLFELKSNGAFQYKRAVGNQSCGVAGSISVQEFQQLSQLIASAAVKVSNSSVIDAPEHVLSTTDLNGSAKRYDLFYGLRQGNLVIESADAIVKKINSLTAAWDKACDSGAKGNFKSLHYKFVGGYGPAPIPMRALAIYDDSDTDLYVRATFHNGSCQVSTFVSRDHLAQLSNLIRSSVVTRAGAVAADVSEVTLTTQDYDQSVASYVLGTPFKLNQLQLSRRTEIRQRIDLVIAEINKKVGCAVQN